MMFLLRLLSRRGGQRSMDPLHVSMTGVRMGERFLLIGGDDKALMAGLAAKVGLSGTAAVAAFDVDQVKRASAIGAKIGALIDAKPIDGAHVPFDNEQFDLVVVDDTGGRFGAIETGARIELLRDARRTVRHGGRIEVVERVDKHAPGYDSLADLTASGFNPVRVLAERDGLRFVEGLRTTSSRSGSPVG